MKKLMPWLRLGAFCFALFAISALAILLKQDRLFSDLKEKSEQAADDAVAKAGLPGEKGATPPPFAAGGTEEAKRAASLESGRALFDLPESISIAEASDLMNELKQQRESNEGRKAALDQREKELQAMEREIEARRTEVMGWAEKLQLNAPTSPLADDGNALDPETLAKVAKIVGAEPETGARMLGGMDPARAAQILLRMDDKTVGAVLGLMEGDKLLRLTTELLKARPVDE